MRLEGDLKELRKRAVEKIREIVESGVTDEFEVLVFDDENQPVMLWVTPKIEDDELVFEVNEERTTYVYSAVGEEDLLTDDLVWIAEELEKIAGGERNG